MKKNELILITETKRLIDYVFVVTQKSSKKYRYSFVTKIHNILLDIIELLYVANSIVLGDNNRSNKKKRRIKKYINSLDDLNKNIRIVFYKDYLLKGNNYNFYNKIKLIN